MSVLISRTYIIPIERLAEAFAAAAEIAPRRREPHEFSITLPDGSTVAFPFAPDWEEPPYVVPVGGDQFLQFPYAVRASGGDEVRAYLRANPDPPFGVKRLKGGGIRIVAPLLLYVSTEPPYASFDFQAEGFSCDVLTLRSVCDVLDYIEQTTGGLVTYEYNPDGRFLVHPFKGQLPRSVYDDDDAGAELARIVEYVRLQGSAY